MIKFSFIIFVFLYGNQVISQSQNKNTDSVFVINVTALSNITLKDEFTCIDFLNGDACNVKECSFSINGDSLSISFICPKSILKKDINKNDLVTLKVKETLKSDFKKCFLLGEVKSKYTCIEDLRK